MNSLAGSCETVTSFIEIDKLNKKYHPIKWFWLACVLSTCLWTSVTKAEENCISFLPHGYNGFYVHLPKNKQFCVETPDGKVNYTTNEMGARVIKGQNSNTGIYLFGESQLIEIFPKNDDLNHMLQTVYGSQNLFLHGAPNNGPNETLAFIRHVARQSPNKIKNITISINLGFDLFRIIPGWKTQDKVPYKSNEISFMMNFPRIFNFINFGKLIINNDIELIDREKQKNMYRNYFSEQETSIINYFEYWIENVEKLKNDLGVNVNLIIFQPWWAYDAKEVGDIAKLNKYYEQKPIEVVCHSLRKYRKLFDNIIYFDFNKNMPLNKLFSYDFRHFIYRHPIIIRNPFKC